MKKIVPLMFALLSAYGTSGAQVKDLNSATDFKNAIKNNDAVVVKFTKTNCPGCDLIHDAYIAVSDSDEYPSVTFARINGAKAGTLLTEYKIESYPVFLFFKHGAKVGREEGGSENAEPVVRHWVEKHLSASASTIPAKEQKTGGPLYRAPAKSSQKPLF